MHHIPTPLLRASDLVHRSVLANPCNIRGFLALFGEMCDVTKRVLARGAGSMKAA